MSAWRPLSPTLHCRRVDVAPSPGPLHHLHRELELIVQDGLLIAITENQSAAMGLAQRAAGLPPGEALAALREGLRARVEAEAGPLPEVLAAVIDPEVGLRAWRAGPNRLGAAGAKGVALIGEDLRFGALARQGAQLPERWRADPLQAEVSALLQLNEAEARQDQVALEFKGGALLLISRGAAPFAAPAGWSSPEAMWALDAGWRHGMGATVIAIADDAGRAPADAALAAWEQAVDADLRRRVAEIDPELLALHDLGQRFIHEDDAARREIAAELLRRGGEALRLLATLARDPALPPEVRRAARAALPDEDADPYYLALRHWLLHLAPEELGLPRADLQGWPFGILMETGYPKGTHTLACFLGGAVHSHTSNGVLDTKAGEHPAVAAQGQAFLQVAWRYWQAATPVEAPPRPGVGALSFVFVSAEGLRCLTGGPEVPDDPTSPLIALHEAGHAVLSELHAVELGLVDAPAVTLPAHTLWDPDPEGELAFLEELLEDALDLIPRMRPALGRAFSDAQRIFGYRVALGRPAEAISASLRDVMDFGVALFQRGEVGPETPVTLSLRGRALEVPGGVSEHTSAPAWLRAHSAATVLRDRAALDSLCRFDPEAFEGDYDAHFDLHARALQALHRGEPGVEGLLAAALSAAARATIYPKLAEAVAVPTLRLTLALLSGDAEAYAVELIEALQRYHGLYTQEGFQHEAANVLPLAALARCAWAQDRGLSCPVQSAYLPAWLVRGE